MNLTCKRKLYFGNATNPETLIIIAVLGIAAAVILPMYNGANTKAKKASTRELFQKIIIDVKRQNNEQAEMPQSLLKEINSQKDSWGKALSSKFQSHVLTIKSAGPDGIAGNSDDLEQSYEWQYK